MQTKQNSGGYTIIEALVVIAVTALIFLSATLLFRGRQAQVQFDQAVKDFESNIRDTMNDVTTGYFPSSTNIACDVTANINDRPQITQNASQAEGLGKDSECIYVGKAIHFVPNGFSGGNSSYSVYNLIGKRFTRQGSFLTADTVAEAKPTPDYQYNKQDFTVRYGVEITKVVINSDSPPLNEYGVVTLLANFTGGNVSDATYQAQNLRVNGLWTSGTKLSLPVSDAVSLINNINDTASNTEGYMDSNSGVIVCLTDGTRKASLQIGAVGGESTVLRIGDVDSKC